MTPWQLMQLTDGHRQHCAGTCTGLNCIHARGGSCSSHNCGFVNVNVLYWKKHVHFCPCYVFFRADPWPQSDTVQGLLIQPLLRIFHQGTVCLYRFISGKLSQHWGATESRQTLSNVSFPIPFQSKINILLSCTASVPAHLIEFHSVFPAFLSPQSPIRAWKASEPGRWKTDRVWEKEGEEGRTVFIKHGVGSQSHLSL